MDYDKIGEFIKNERKAKKLTQAKLAEKIFVSEKTISKWESGKGLPDTNTLPKLCEVFGISLNELLNGEKIKKEKYEKMAEEKLLDVQRGKEESDKRLLVIEIVFGFFSLLFMFSLMLISIFVAKATWLQIVLIVCAFVQFIVAMFICLRIEQKAGLYECNKCHHKYVPTYNQVFWSMHVNRTRFMKCPNCKKHSWCKKVVK